MGRYPLATLNVPRAGGLAATPGSCRRIAEREMNKRNGRHPMDAEPLMPTGA